MFPAMECHSSRLQVVLQAQINTPNPIGCCDPLRPRADTEHSPTIVVTKSCGLYKLTPPSSTDKALTQTTPLPGTALYSLLEVIRARRTARVSNLSTRKKRRKSLAPPLEPPLPPHQCLAQIHHHGTVPALFGDDPNHLPPPTVARLAGSARQGAAGVETRLETWCSMLSCTGGEGREGRTAWKRRPSDEVLWVEKHMKSWGGMEMDCLVWWCCFSFLLSHDILTILKVLDHPPVRKT